ncbi:ELMO domain-containing protein [Aureococcus anophagefferens]|nr:ELMO domain-containing protein [Aureococcus anophagefferens]
MGGRGAPREASDDEARVLAAVEGELNRSFDEASDLPLLKRLWEDPISDLRGGGVLGLANLVAFLERSPSSRPIMASRRPAAAAFDPEQPGFYPFACAGINVTLALCEFAGLRGPGGSPKPAARPELSFWPLLAGGGAWDAAYAVGFRLLDRSFDSKRASYMDFNAVRKEAGLKLAPHGWGATAPARSGALEKLPVSGLVTSRKVSKWKRRHFVLRGDVVAWFKPVGDRPGAQASPAAAKADAAAWAKAEVERCANFDGSKGKLRLKASSANEARAWMAAIEKAIAAAPPASPEGRQRAPPPPAPARATTSTPTTTARRAGACAAEPQLGRAAEHVRGRVVASVAAVAGDARAAAPPSDRDLMAENAVALGRTALEDAPPPPPAGAAGRSGSRARTTARSRVHRPTGATQWDLPPGWASSSSGWAARVDARSGHTYYFFPPTGETAWTLPER